MNELAEGDLGAIHGLVADLRLQKFPVGVGHYLRLEQLLSRVGGDRPARELKTLLCPLFATDARQQEVFYRTFERHFGEQPAPIPIPEPPVEPGSGPEVKRARRIRRWLPLLVGALLLGGAAVYLVLRPTSVPQPPPSAAAKETSPRPGPGRPPDEVPRQVRPDLPARPARPDRPVRPADRLREALLGSVLALLLLQQWARYRRRQLVLERARLRNPPLGWPLRRPPLAIKDHRSEQFYRAARLLRRRRISDVMRLDVPRSIAATVEAGGLASLCSRPDSESPEYLVLVERRSPRDHQARLFDRLAKALEGEGLFLVRYFYSADPRLCSAADGSGTFRLIDLQRKYPEHRLLLFTAGEELLDPISGALSSWAALLLEWRVRAVLTPQEKAAWGVQERTLAESFLVLPATVGGLNELADRLDLPARLAPVERDGAEAPAPLLVAGRPVRVDRLRGHLGEPGFQWLCACAVYPELHWDMTLYLGSRLAPEGGWLREGPLLGLARLPWFRRGSLPEDLRLELIERLDPAREQEVREAVADLLRDNPARPGSFAASSRDLQVLAQRIQLARGDRRKLRRELRRLHQFPASDVAEDAALLRFLREAEVSRLAVRLPAAVRELLFERGIPALGLRTAASLLGAMGVALLAFEGSRLVIPSAPGMAEKAIANEAPRETEASSGPGSPGTQDPAKTEPPQETEPSSGTKRPAGTEIPIDTEPPSGTETPPPPSGPSVPPGGRGPMTDGSLGVPFAPDTGPRTGPEVPPGRETPVGTEAGTEPGVSTPPAAPVPAEVAKESVKPPAGPVKPGGGIEGAVLSALSRFSNESDGRLFLGSKIPQDRLWNVKQATGFKDDDMLALIDASFWSTGKVAFVFGRKGVYFKDLLGKPQFIPYDEFIKIHFESRSKWVPRVSLGGERTFSFLGWRPPSAALQMLQEVQQALVDSGALRGE